MAEGQGPAGAWVSGGAFVGASVRVLPGSTADGRGAMAGGEALRGPVTVLAPRLAPGLGRAPRSRRA